MKTHASHIALALLLVWTAACLAPWLPWLAWKLNQREIAEKLCENRMRPQLQCNGKCYLAKQLRAAEEQPASQAAAPVECPVFGWIGGLLPIDTVECPLPPKEAERSKLPPRNAPPPLRPYLSPDTPPPWLA